jgi:hypothetical protein
MVAIRQFGDLSLMSCLHIPPLAAPVIPQTHTHPQWVEIGLAGPSNRRAIAAN